MKQTIADAQENPLAPSAYLGVITQDVTTDLAFQLGLEVDEGAYVVSTTADGPAEGVGIQEGDVIVSIDGHDVVSGQDVGDILEGLDPGQQVPVEIVGTDGARRTIDVTLASRPGPSQLP